MKKVREVGSSVQKKLNRQLFLVISLPLFCLVLFSYSNSRTGKENKKTLNYPILPTTTPIISIKENIEGRWPQLKDKIGKNIDAIQALTFLSFGLLLYGFEGRISSSLLKVIEAHRIVESSSYNTMDLELFRRIARGIIYHLIGKKDRNGTPAISNFISILDNKDDFTEVLNLLKKCVEEIRKQSMTKEKINEELNSKFVIPMLRNKLKLTIINKETLWGISGSLLYGNLKVIDIDLDGDIHSYLSLKNRSIIGRFFWPKKVLINVVTEEKIKEVIDSIKKEIESNLLNKSQEEVSKELIANLDNNDPINRGIGISQPTTFSRLINNRNRNNNLKRPIPSIDNITLMTLDLNKDEAIRGIKGYEAMTEEQQLSFITELRKRKENLIVRLKDENMKDEELLNYDFYNSQVQSILFRDLEGNEEASNNKLQSYLIRQEVIKEKIEIEKKNKKNKRNLHPFSNDSLSRKRD